MNDIGLKRGSVVLKPYNNLWTMHFEREKHQILALIDDITLQIEHIGSTAIPGILAKPIIDILIGVWSLNEMEELRAKLEKAGYEYRENGSSNTQILLVKGAEENRTHYLHIVIKDSPEWLNNLAFRDYLKSNSLEAERYEKLKKKLAAQYPNNRTQYTKGKSRFIKSILNKIRRLD